MRSVNALWGARLQILRTETSRAIPSGARAMAVSLSRGSQKGHGLP
jgi:hypothetical protein